MFSNSKGSRSDAPSLSRGALPSARLADVSNVDQQRSLASSVIGPDLVISGNLITKGQVQIEGDIEGDVHGIHVLVAEEGCITGLISAEEIIVRGRVMGSICGKRVMLQSSCHVEGDIFHESLTIEDGAAFEGRAQRSHAADLVPPKVPAATSLL